MTAKEAFLGAVEDVVARRLVPVPSGPLMALSEAVAGIEDELAEQSRTMDADDRLNDVLYAAETVEWSFWPAAEFGSRQALVHPDTVQTLADALHAYREFVRES